MDLELFGQMLLRIGLWLLAIGVGLFILMKLADIASAGDQKRAWWVTFQFLEIGFTTVVLGLVTRGIAKLLRR